MLALNNVFKVYEVYYGLTKSNKNTMIRKSHIQVCSLGEKLKMDTEGLLVGK